MPAPASTLTSQVRHGLARVALLGFQNDAQHATQWLCSTPQQLIADGKGRQIFAAHRHLAQTTDRDREAAGDSCR
jgi:hypothetical protein